MLITEDGTGIPDANAYVTASYIENYLMGDRLARFNGLSDEDKDAAIISGTQLVDISYNWIGSRQSLEQGLNWPRTGVELYGFAVEGIPVQVMKAVCEAVWLSLTEDSLFSNDNNREVSSERVDVIAVTYVNPKDRLKESATRFEILDKLLRGLYAEEKLSGSSVGTADIARA